MGKLDYEDNIHFVIFIFFLYEYSGQSLKIPKCFGCTQWSYWLVWFI